MMGAGVEAGADGWWCGGHNGGGAGDGWWRGGHNGGVGMIVVTPVVVAGNAGVGGSSIRYRNSRRSWLTRRVVAYS